MIPEHAALAIARDRAQANGWAFSEPVAIVLRRPWTGGNSRYEIETNAGHLGTKATFVVDAETGTVLSEGYVPR
jgi:uncharacterized membrane protein YkoI